MPYQDNAYGLYEIHRMLLEMMVEVDRVCREEDIPYSLLGGTMLGAARHKGFIPWDDDLDIVFTAEALERFLQVFPQKSEKYTTSLEDTWVARVVPREPINGQRPFVDLFHYEPISETGWKQKMKILMLQTLQGMLKEKTDLSRFGLKDKVLLGGTHVLGKLFSKKCKLRMYRWVSSHVARGDGSLLHISDDQFGCLKVLYRAECTQEMIDTPFETATLRMSALYDEMLTRQYGDYMTPPPVEKRVPMHANWRE